MSFDSRSLPSNVAKALRAYLVRSRLYAFLRVPMGALLLIMVLALVVMHIDRFAFLDVDLRVWLRNGVWAVGGIMFVIELICFLVKQPSARDVAYALEKQLGDEGTQERLVTAESLRREYKEYTGPIQEQLANSLLQSADEFGAKIAAAKLAKNTSFKRRLIGVGLLLVLYGVLLIPQNYQFSLMNKRFFMPTANLAKPSFVDLSVTEIKPVGKGGECVLQVTLDGKMPAWLSFFYNVAGIPANECRVASADDIPDNISFKEDSIENMNRISRKVFVLAKSELQETFSYKVRYADAQTKIHTVKVVPYPKLKNVLFTVYPPEYTELSEQTYQSPKEPMEVFSGSKVVVQFEATQALKEYSVLMNEAKQIDIEWDSEARVGSFVLDSLTENAELAISVVNEYGFKNRRGGRYTLSVREDQSPVLQLVSPVGRVRSVPGEIIPVRVKIQDDLDVEKVEILHKVNPDAAQGTSYKKNRVSIENVEGSFKDGVLISGTINLQRIGVVPGDKLRFFVSATDSGKNTGKSQAIDINVISFARGINEARRLEVMDFLLDALATLGGKGEYKVNDPKMLWKLLREDVAEASEEVKPFKTEKDILSLLKREHYLTDHPIDKMAVRYLALQVTELVYQQQQQGQLQAGLARFKNEAGDWLLYRQWRNLAWQVFGLQGEVSVLKGKISKIADKRKELYNDNLRALYETMWKALTRGLKSAEYKKTADELEAFQEELSEAKKARIRFLSQFTQEVTGQQNPSMILEPEETDDEYEAFKKLDKPVKEKEELVQEKRKEFENIFASQFNQILEEYKKKLTLDPDAKMTQGDNSRRRKSEKTIRQHLISSLRNMAPKVDKGDLSAGRARLAIKRELKSILDSMETSQGMPERIQRRVDVFRKTVSKAGDRLQMVADRIPGVDAEGLKEVVGKLNSAAYRIANSEKMNRAKYLCQDIFDMLTVFIEGTLIPPFNELAEKGVADVVELEEGYLAARKRLINAIGSAKPEEQHKILEALATDAHMIERSPFESVWAYGRNLAALEYGYSANLGGMRLFAAGGTKEGLKNIALENPTEEHQRLKERLLVMYGDWQRRHLQNISRLTDLERDLDQALEVLQFAYLNDPEGLETTVDEVKAWISGSDAEKESLPDIKVFRNRTGTRDLLALKRSTLSDLESISLQKNGDRLYAVFAEASGALSEFEGNTDASSDVIIQTTKQLVDRLRLCATDLERTILTLQLRLETGTVEASQRPLFESVYLALRNVYENWRNRALPKLQTLADTVRSGKEGGMPLDVGSLFTAVGVLKAQVDGYLNKLQVVKDNFSANSADISQWRSGLGLAEQLDASEKNLEKARVIVSKQTQASAKQVLFDHENVSRRLILSRVKLIKTAAENVDRIRKVLKNPERSAFSAEELNEVGNQVVSDLSQFIEEISFCAPLQIRDELLSDTQSVLREFKAVGQLGETLTDNTKRQQAVFSLSGIADKLVTINRRPRVLRAELSGSSSRFRGKPDGMFADRYRRSVGHMAVSMGQMFEQGEIRLTDAISGIIMNGNRQGYLFEDTVDWNALAYGMLRSSLSTTSDEGRQGPQEPDKWTLKKWLQVQVENSKEELRVLNVDPYHRLTDEYLGAFSDYLRYY